MWVCKPVNCTVHYYQYKQIWPDPFSICEQYKCDQVCQNGSYTRTVSRHTFHRHLITTPMDQQHMCLILLKVDQSTFTQISFSSLSDIHECSGGLKMAPSSLDKERVSCNSPHDWLMSLAMNSAAYCNMWK